MKNEIEEGVRLATEIAKRRTPTSHLPKDVLRAAVAYARRRCSTGASQVLIARELGVSAVTVARWLNERGAGKPRRLGPVKQRNTKMRAVRVVDNVRPLVTAIVATTRDGLRIED